MPQIGLDLVLKIMYYLYIFITFSALVFLNVIFN